MYTLKFVKQPEGINHIKIYHFLFNPRLSMMSECPKQASGEI